MVTKPRRNLADIAKREYQLKQQRKRAKKMKKTSSYKAKPIMQYARRTEKEMRELLQDRKRDPKFRDILKPRQGTKKKIDPKKIKGTQSTVAQKQPKPRKQVEVKKRKPLFGSVGMKKKYIPKKKHGGVVMQKIKKYNEGGIVIHDQTTSRKV